MQIQSGTGNSKWAKVDELNRLHTVAVTQSEMEFISSRTGNAYTVTTDNFTFNSTNEHPWLYIRNNEPTFDMYFNSIIYSFNGGNTNHNRTLIKRMYRNPPLPTSNYSNIDAVNLNFGSLRAVNTTNYSWDGGSSDGMTVDLSQTTNTLTSTVQSGTLVLSDVEGIIIPYGTSVLVSFEPEEIGNASISIKMFFKTKL